MRAYILVSGLLFGVVAVVHILRLAYGWPVQIAGLSVPMDVSWAGIVVPGALCVWAFALARRPAP
jgi:hypothetical protein